MNILHYSLGFPPYRSGGLTKFCMDLMKQQKNEGHKVALLWPGRMNLRGGGTAIKDRGYVDFIRSFEIVNPLPISYDEGISDIDLFTTDVDETVYEPLLKKLSPDIIHLHTLMGLHMAFILCAKNLGIKLIFTAHDFFPICPKVTMYRKKAVCTSAKSCKDCASCNSAALTISRIKLLQSPLYRKLKDNIIIKKIRKKHRNNFLYSEETVKNTDIVRNIGEKNFDYIGLRKIYEKMLQMMDYIHYNSSVTQQVYKNFMELKNYKILPITHGDIADKRKVKKFNGQLRFSYLGPKGGAKGFFY